MHGRASGKKQLGVWMRSAFIRRRRTGRPNCSKSTSGPGAAARDEAEVQAVVLGQRGDELLRVAAPAAQLRRERVAGVDGDGRHAVTMPCRGAACARERSSGRRTPRPLGSRAMSRGALGLFRTDDDRSPVQRGAAPRRCRPSAREAAAPGRAVLVARAAPRAGRARHVEHRRRVPAGGAARAARRARRRSSRRRGRDRRRLDDVVHRPRATRSRGAQLGRRAPPRARALPRAAVARRPRPRAPLRPARRPRPARPAARRRGLHRLLARARRNGRDVQAPGSPRSRPAASSAFTTRTTTPIPA